MAEAEDRYSRLRLISWWDQERLRNASVMVVGAGALGNEILKNLALLGVARIFIIDMDEITITNLTRSVLYRASDIGRSKAEAAAQAVKELNPDVQVAYLHGSVITDLGLGAFQDMDLLLGGLDSREARLWINRQSCKVNLPYVDGAIQEISGVVKVFTPPEGSCFECGMTRRDYELINQRYSCPLLKREDIAKGHIPTAPTISSIIGALQVQEGLKILHNLPVESGTALVFNGESNNLYHTKIPVKPDCQSHDTYGQITDFDLGADNTARELFDSTGGVRIYLDRDVVVDLVCPSCGLHKDTLKPLMAVCVTDAECPDCHATMNPAIVSTVERGGPLEDRPLLQLGVPYYDILKVETPDGGLYAKLSADRDRILNWQ
jgi:adenylyltransferase/sulfurtransferase